MAGKKTGNTTTKTAAKPAAQQKPETKPATPQRPAPMKDAGPKLTDITSAYLKKKELYDRQHETLTKRIESSRSNIERIQATMTKAELQLSQLSAPSVKDDLVEPLAKELLKLLPGCAGYEVIGPVGVQQAITISFAAKGATDEQRLSGENCRSVTFITKTESGGIGVRDYSKSLDQYKPGSIGYASGLNHPVLPVPEDATVKWLLDWVK